MRLRTTNIDLARKVAKTPADLIVKSSEKHGHDVVAGDCTLANGGLALETGSAPTHPLQFLASAYGIPEED